MRTTAAPGRLSGRAGASAPAVHATRGPVSRGRTERSGRCPSAAEALCALAGAFASHDAVAVDLAARRALHAGASHLDVAQVVLDQVADTQRAGGGLLDTSSAEMRARWALCRLGDLRAPRGRRVLLFLDRTDAVSIAFDVVVTAASGWVSTAMSADPSQLVDLAFEQPWDVVVVDHVSLRRSARTVREFLAPLLGLEHRPHVVVTTAVPDQAAAPERGVTWVPRELRAMVLATGVLPDDPLTDREREVLAAVAAGRSNEQIGRQLQLSLSTVKTYLERIHAKLGSVDRASAVATAVRGGWI